MEMSFRNLCKARKVLQTQFIRACYESSTHFSLLNFRKFPTWNVLSFSLEASGLLNYDITNVLIVCHTDTSNLKYESYSSVWDSCTQDDRWRHEMTWKMWTSALHSCLMTTSFHRYMHYRCVWTKIIFPNVNTFRITVVIVELCMSERQNMWDN